MTNFPIKEIPFPYDYNNPPPFLKPGEIPGRFNQLIIGPIGTGKTTVLRSWVALGGELFVLATEPGANAILGDLPKERCHWHYVTPAGQSWPDIEQMARNLNALSVSDIVNMKFPKNKHQQFLQIIGAFNNFTCDRTGISFGDVSTWGSERMLAVDGLSGLSKTAIDLIVGPRPVRSLPEYAVAQHSIMEVLTKLISDLKCQLVVLSHAEKREHEITGAQTIFSSSIGKALKDELPKPFDEVTYSKRVGKDFYWSTIEPNVELKTRLLPFDAAISPNYSLIVDALKQRAAASSRAV